MMIESASPYTTLNNNTAYEWMLHTDFTVSARGHSVQLVAPYISDLVRPGAEILDLCCGSGPMSFWFEEQGAQVTGVDPAPYMIALARDEAFRRNSSVKFFEADIFSYDLGRARYDLIACFGNGISDFSLSHFAGLVQQLFQALRPGGRFVLDYQDESYERMQGRAAHEGVIQETPVRITFFFEEYLPKIGARVHTIRNETRGEAYQRKAYIYTVPVVQLAVSGPLALERHVVVGENSFLDTFVKTE